MNTKITLFIRISLALCFFYFPIFAQSDIDNEASYDTIKVVRNFQDPSKPLKAIIFDGGYGFDGASFAFGLRYWNISTSIGVAGLAVSSPPYSNDRPFDYNYNEPLPQGYSRTRVPGKAVFVDAGYYLNLETLNFFILFGFFAQSNTNLAYNNQTSTYYYLNQTKNDGYTLGGGMEGKLSPWIRLAGGYHSKRGFFLRIAYTWR